SKQESSQFRQPAARGRHGRNATGSTPPHVLGEVIIDLGHAGGLGTVCRKRGAVRRSRGWPGWLHVWVLEHRLTRMWEPGTLPPPESLVAVMTLAAVPRALGARLAEHLDGGLVVGPGSVPDLPA